MRRCRDPLARPPAPASSLAITLVVAACILGACCPSPAQDLGIQLDQSQWECHQEGAGTCDWEQKAISVVVAEPRAGYSVATCRTPIEGDFEAQVSYELLAWQGGPGLSASMDFTLALPAVGTEGSEQVVQLGHNWTGAFDMLEALTFHQGTWKHRVGEITAARSGRLQIVRRGSQVETAYQTIDAEGVSWKTVQVFDTDRSAAATLQLAARNSAPKSTAHAPIHVRFSDLTVQRLAPPGKGGFGTGATPPEGTTDWVVYATGPSWEPKEDPQEFLEERKAKHGWLRIGPRPDLEKEFKRKQEIWGGNSDEPLPRILLAEGFASREETLDFLCPRLTKVHINYVPTFTPKETVKAMFEGFEYHLRLDRGNSPDSVLFRGEEYDFEAEKKILRAYGITPRADYGMKWLVHATGHSTRQGPVKDDHWLLLGSEPTLDPKDPPNGRFVVADGWGGTFTYSTDQWEGPYRDNYAVATALRRIGVDRLDLPSVSRYNRVLVVAEIPEDARDHGGLVPGVQTIVDPAELREWVAYVTADKWLHVGTRKEFETPVPVKGVIWGGKSDAPATKQIVDLGQVFSNYEQVLATLVPRLRDVTIEYHPNATPRETVSAKIGGKDCIVQIARPADTVVSEYMNYSLNAERNLMLRFGVVPKKHFGKQWLVHATGHGTYSGPVKDDHYMMVSSQPKDGKVRIPDGMGGTFGYTVDIVEGPFTDSEALAKALKAKGLENIRLAGSRRSVDADDAVTPPKPPKPNKPKILSITPDYGEPGSRFYVTVIAEGMKPWYRFQFGRGVYSFDETSLGKNPDGPGERWLATIAVDDATTFSVGH